MTWWWCGNYNPIVLSLKAWFVSLAGAVLLVWATRVDQECAANQKCHWVGAVLLRRLPGWLLLQVGVFLRVCLIRRSRLNDPSLNKTAQWLAGLLQLTGSTALLSVTYYGVSCTEKQTGTEATLVGAVLVLLSCVFGTFSMKGFGSCFITTYYRNTAAGQGPASETAMNIGSIGMSFLGCCLLTAASQGAPCRDFRPNNLHLFQTTCQHSSERQCVTCGQTLLWLGWLFVLFGCACPFIFQLGMKNYAGCCFTFLGCFVLRMPIPANTIQQKCNFRYDQNRDYESYWYAGIIIVLVGILVGLGSILWFGHRRLPQLPQLEASSTGHALDEAILEENHEEIDPFSVSERLLVAVHAAFFLAVFVGSLVTVFTLAVVSLLYFCWKGPDRHRPISPPQYHTSDDSDTVATELYEITVEHDLSLQVEDSHQISSPESAVTAKVDNDSPVSSPSEPHCI